MGHHDEIGNEIGPLRMARSPASVRRAGLLPPYLGADVGCLGTQSHGRPGRSPRSVVDLDSGGCCFSLCGALGRPGGGMRSWPATRAVASPLVVVSDHPPGTPGLLADSRGSCHALGEPWTAVRPAALTASIPALVLTLLILVITDGLGEELGWRGYLLPRLLSRYRAVTASLILGFGWWLWHLPLVWTADATLEGQPLWFLLADLMAKSMIFTYVFLRTQGSVLIAILLHASTNLFAVSPRLGENDDLTLPLVALVLKIALAVALAVRLPRDSSGISY